MRPMFFPLALRRQPALDVGQVRGQVLTHKACKGTGIQRARLAHPWADDGKEHFIRCAECQGTGVIEKQSGRGVSARAEHL